MPPNNLTETQAESDADADIGKLHQLGNSFQHAVSWISNLNLGTVGNVGNSTLPAFRIYRIAEFLQLAGAVSDTRSPDHISLVLPIAILPRNLSGRTATSGTSATATGILLSLLLLLLAVLELI